MLQESLSWAGVLDTWSEVKDKEEDTKQISTLAAAGALKAAKKCLAAAEQALLVADAAADCGRHQVFDNPTSSSSTRQTPARCDYYHVGVVLHGFETMVPPTVRQLSANGSTKVFSPQVGVPSVRATLPLRKVRLEGRNGSPSRASGPSRNTESRWARSVSPMKGRSCSPSRSESRCARTASPMKGQLQTSYVPSVGQVLAGAPVRSQVPTTMPAQVPTTYGGGVTVVAQALPRCKSPTRARGSLETAANPQTKILSRLAQPPPCTAASMQQLLLRMPMSSATTIAATLGPDSLPPSSPPLVTCKQQEGWRRTFPSASTRLSSCASQDVLWQSSASVSPQLSSCVSLEDLEALKAQSKATMESWLVVSQDPVPSEPFARTVTRQVDELRELCRDSRVRLLQKSHAEATLARLAATEVEEKANVEKVAGMNIALEVEARLAEEKVSAEYAAGKADAEKGVARNAAVEKERIETLAVERAIAAERAVAVAEARRAKEKIAAEKVATEKASEKAGAEQIAAREEAVEIEAVARMQQKAEEKEAADRAAAQTEARIAVRKIKERADLAAAVVEARLTKEIEAERVDAKRMGRAAEKGAEKVAAKIVAAGKEAIEKAAAAKEAAEKAAAETKAKLAKEIADAERAAAILEAIEQVAAEEEVAARRVKEMADAEEAAAKKADAEKAAARKIAAEKEVMGKVAAGKEAAEMAAQVVASRPMGKQVQVGVWIKSPLQVASVRWPLRTGDCSINPSIQFETQGMVVKADAEKVAEKELMDNAAAEKRVVERAAAEGKADTKKTDTILPALEKVAAEERAAERAPAEAEARNAEERAADKKAKEREKAIAKKLVAEKAVVVEKASSQRDREACSIALVSEPTRRASYTSMISSRRASLDSLTSMSSVAMTAVHSSRRRWSIELERLQTDLRREIEQIEQHTQAEIAFHREATELQDFMDEKLTVANDEMSVIQAELERLQIEMSDDLQQTEPEVQQVENSFPERAIRHQEIFDDTETKSNDELSLRRANLECLQTNLPCEMKQKGQQAYRIGDLVDCRDDDMAEWEEGVVTSIKPLKVKPNGWDGGHSWEQIRHKASH